MPEILEVEQYRSLAERVVGRRVTDIDAPDAWYLKGGLDAEVLAAAVAGRTVTAARRVGKLLLLDLRGAPTLGLRFGMTGRLVVDGIAVIGELVYGPAGDRPDWERLRLGFSPGGTLAVTDPRRLGGVELDPDETRLGPDAMAVTGEQLATLLAGGRGPLKARLTDQRRLAGLGNLLSDEILWRAGIDPARAAGSLTAAEVATLHDAIRSTLAILAARGGSHTGDLQPERRAGGVCPLDAVPLSLRPIGGRSTYACPVHQR